MVKFCPQITQIDADGRERGSEGKKLSIGHVYYIRLLLLQ